uniref:Uncharacterized protein n=1 Tax=Knipowitschia caucasica TaxID=637954 RepID=A0AAV2J476_KNICA
MRPAKRTGGLEFEECESMTGGNGDRCSHHHTYSEKLRELNPGRSTGPGDDGSPLCLPTTVLSVSSATWTEGQRSNGDAVSRSAMYAECQPHPTEAVWGWQVVEGQVMKDQQPLWRRPGYSRSQR